MALLQIIFEVAVTIFVIELNSVEGANTSLACMTGGYPTRNTSLICSITGNITTAIIFARPNDGSPQQVIVCAKGHNNCFPQNHISGYSAVISSSRSQITLLIKSFNRTADAGEWICVDGTSLDEGAKCNKTVLYGPESIRFISHPPDNIKEGRSLIVNCAADCNPPCNYSWTLNNEQISSGSVLNLTYINRTQAGLYNCTVTNSFIPQSKSKQFTLRVYYPPNEAPVISGTVFPVFEGDNITLNCSTTGGNPKPNLTWFCPGGSTSCSDSDSGETRTCTISITANRSQNNENCTCTPSWQYGGYTESKSRRMIIHFSPGTPTLSPNSTHPWLEDRPGSLICSLPSGDQGNPEATFHWIRNNNDIEHTGFNYTFTPSKEHNGDKYKCTAGNNFTDRDGQSRPVSRPVQLNVYYYPRIQIALSTHDSRKEGDDLTLTCTADSNPSPSSLTWMFGGQTVGHDRSLRLTNLSREEHGQYTCEANVSAGRHGNLVNSSDVQVVVNYAPSVTFLSLNSTENNSSSIICSADGRPGNMNFRSFSHYWNSVKIRNVAGRSIGSNQYVLTFNRSRYEDSGTYYCTVDNGVPDRSGNISQTATSEVFISGTPKITKETKVDDILGVEVNKSAVLQKTVFSKPNYTDIYWTKSGNNANYSFTAIKEETITLDIHKKTVEDSGYRISLNISRFRQEDIGTYTLTVCNGVGCSRFSVNLTAAGPPFPPKEFKQEGESMSETVRLSWLPNYPGGNFKQRFILEYKLQSESEWKTGWTSDWFKDLPQDQKMFYNITNLEASQVYDIRLSAENERPKDNVSEFVTVTAMTAKEAEKPTGSGFRIGAAVGGAVSSVAVVGVIVVLVVFFVRRSRLSSKNKKDTENGLRTNRDSENLPALPVLDDNELYFMSGGGGGGGDAPNRGDDASKPKLPVLEDNDLYFSSGGVKKMELPVLEDNELYYTSQGSGVKGQKEPVSQTSPMRDGAQPSTSTQNDDKKDNKKGQKEMKKTQDDKKAEKNKKKKEQEKSKDKEKKAKDADKKVKKGKKGDKMPLNQAARGDAYENVDLGKDNTYANAAFDGKEDEVCQNVQGAKCGRDEDGLVYVGIDFSSTTPSRSVHKTEESVEYMSIDWNKKAQPLPDGDEPKKEKSEK